MAAWLLNLIRLAGVAFMMLLTPNPVLSRVELPAGDTEVGFIARLLINEVPFPGEKGYVSEQDTRATMDALLAVLANRTHRIPAPYTQIQVAAVTSNDLLDVITAGGERGQVDGFYRDAAGHLRTHARVEQRVDYLLQIANQGQPGAFARLLNHAVDMAEKAKQPNRLTDPYAELHAVGTIAVTGYGFAWMTDLAVFHPGGNFVAIPNDHEGSRGGNRFYTLRRSPQ